jgi:hypothetical protein
MQEAPEDERATTGLLTTLEPVVVIVLLIALATVPTLVSVHPGTSIPRR